ncbi:Kazal-type serine protease inhibitor domain-containing protein 1, partial [Goodea atripinnis]
PVIKVPPQNQVKGTGSSLVFLCEVFAFPLALVEWRKDGCDGILPGDDPHISVQVCTHLKPPATPPVKATVHHCLSSQRH